MNPESKYSNLYSFLSAEFAEADLEHKTDQEVIESCIDSQLNQWYRQIIVEGRNALASDNFPWQEVSNYANRYFTNEETARIWLTAMLDLLETQIKINS